MAGLFVKYCIIPIIGLVLRIIRPKVKYSKFKNAFLATLWPFSVLFRVWESKHHLQNMPFRSHFIVYLTYMTYGLIFGCISFSIYGKYQNTTEMTILVNILPPAIYLIMRFIGWINIICIKNGIITEKRASKIRVLWKIFRCCIIFFNIGSFGVLANISSIMTIVVTAFTYSDNPDNPFYNIFSYSVFYTQFFTVFDYISMPYKIINAIDKPHTKKYMSGEENIVIVRTEKGLVCLKKTGLPYIELSVAVPVFSFVDPNSESDFSFIYDYTVTKIR